MQHIKILLNWLDNNINDTNYLFLFKDLRALFPEISINSYKTLLSRAATNHILQKISRNLYAYKPEKHSKGWLLFHASAYLRSDHFNYISLETVLSDIGVISQMPINYITIMTSGRSNIIDCGKWGKIEFIHTSKTPHELSPLLTYDTHCKLWRASLKLAIKDMKKTKRNCDLINWDMVNELI